MDKLFLTILIDSGIPNILNFRKPSRMIIVASLALVAVLGVGCTVNRASIIDRESPMKGINLSDSQPDDIVRNVEQITGVRKHNHLDDLDSWHGSLNGKPMTLDDIRELAAKGDNLLFEDLRQYQGGNVSSNLDRYIIVYGVAGGYRLVVHSNSTDKPDRVNLQSIWEGGWSGIDIRNGDIDEFLRVNPSQDAITEEQARDIAQAALEVELEPVSWYILGDWPERTDNDAVFARSLLDSTDTIGEPCWVLRVKSTPEWGGHYYAVGKKSGTIFTYNIGTWFAFTGTLE